MIKIICVAGAKPNFVKIAPIIRVLDETGGFQTLFVHTGQHYDKNMSMSFFDDLGIRKPDVNLGVGSASHAVQTAEIMKRFESVVLDFDPDYVLVVGDVNSTIACGLVAVKRRVKLIHVEAGLRSFDRTMPEEINRVLTDSISDLLFVTEQSGIENLQKEGINSDKVYFVGNVMIDTLMANLQKVQESDVLRQLGLSAKEYAVITLHRPSNVDDTDKFGKIIAAFEEIEKEIKLVFPVHPRTRSNLEGSKLGKRLEAMTNLLLTEPLGYLDFLCLTSNAAFVLTDSGGIQEETTFLCVPCITLRENTERPVTIAEGTNRLVYISTEAILKNYREIRVMPKKDSHSVPRLWDGKTSQRIAQIIMRHRIDTIGRNIIPQRKEDIKLDG